MENASQGRSVGHGDPRRFLQHAEVISSTVRNYRFKGKQLNGAKKEK